MGDKMENLRTGQLVKCIIPAGTSFFYGGYIPENDTGRILEIKENRILIDFTSCNNFTCVFGEITPVCEIGYQILDDDKIKTEDGIIFNFTLKTISTGICIIPLSGYRELFVNQEIRDIIKLTETMEFENGEFIGDSENFPLEEILDRKITKCDDCGNIHFLDDSTEIDGNQICESCRDDNYYSCENCGDYISTDDGTAIHDDRGNSQIFCDSCRDRIATQCDDCGDWFNIGIHTDNRGVSYCDQCSESYCLCDECGDWVHCDYLCSNDDGNYCENCYSEQDNSQYVHNYNYKPTANFHGTGNLFFGLEIETDANSYGDIDTDILESLAEHDNKFYLKEDGSLNYGFELVTHPYTLESLTENREFYEGIMKSITDAGYRSHDVNTTGLHIHASRAGFGDTTREQEDTIIKCIYLFEKYFNQFLIFSRRTENQLARWAMRYFDDCTNITYKHCSDCKNNFNGKYHAINLEPRDTIEFRFFKGTLKFSTVLASVQLVSNLIHICKDFTIEGVENVKFQDIVEYVKYAELLEYSKDKGLI